MMSTHACCILERALSKPVLRATFHESMKCYIAISSGVVRTRHVSG